MACGSGVGDIDDAPRLRVTAVWPGLWVPGARVTLEFDGRPPAGTPSIRVRGSCSAEGVPAASVDLQLDEPAPAFREGQTVIVGRLPARAFIPNADGCLFDGAIEVSLQAQLTARTTWSGRWERVPVPRLQGPAAGTFSFGDNWTLSGEGFWIDAAEGRTELVLDGVFEPVGAASRAIRDLRIGTTPDPSARNRDRATYVHRPSVFGLSTGTFSGQARLSNISASGGERSGPPLQVRWTVAAPRIDGLGLTSAPRGRWVPVAGSGIRLDASDGATVMLRWVGQWTPVSGRSARVDERLLLEHREGSGVSFAIRPHRAPDGRTLQGIGATPGTFDGTVQPMITWEGRTLPGAARAIRWTVDPPVQVVWVRFLPAFGEALSLFGLRNLEAPIRDRALTAARRDYAPYAVDLRTERPIEFAQYTTVEVTGDDPSEADLFGLDNTSGKDTGNWRLDDYVGGRASVGEAGDGTFSYGGVFAASMLRFSPSICRSGTADGMLVWRPCANNTFPLADRRFDAIFGPFAPLLGGTEARIDESISSPRRMQVQEAVRVFGNLVGGTLVHELGHALGLASDVGDDPFHNRGDIPGFIMNPGSARSFAERAELAGTPPATWAPGDDTYLRQTLGRADEAAP